MIIQITGITTTKYGIMAYFIITYNGLIYEWCDYVDGNTPDQWQAFLNAKISEYTTQIDTMEAAWAVAPKTRMDENGIEVPVSKTEYVHPILKDYDALREASITDNLPTRAEIDAKFTDMTTKATAATSVALLRAQVLALITITKKIAMVVYWLAKNKDI